ncbi:hypothetical protein SADUNF_Sadunf11G0112700 [Salix dunnii]|uniref:Uncharacterized protein n=1 Tax=Salix dunnii TaxID=1413687 RepID=A0A835JPB3_9ROSI|nr:hypothetical protein SADUNF_Sadunf11G0112700 [Salix dunnii]
MNSMFSSFDALCNEFLNQKVKSSFAYTAMDSNTKRVLSSQVGDDNLIKNQEGSSSRSLARKQEKKKMPRFAPELDGLNCFETFEIHREETDRNYSLIDLSEILWALELAPMEGTVCEHPRLRNEQLMPTFTFWLLVDAFYPKNRSSQQLPENYRFVSHSSSIFCFDNLMFQVLNNVFNLKQRWVLMPIQFNYNSSKQH